MAYQAGDPDRVAFQPRSSNLNLEPTARPNGFRFPRPPVSALQVLKSFNTRAFKREQPDNPDLMLEIIADAIARHEPIPFVMYWGKGLRPVLAHPELACLDYLASMVGRIPKVYSPGGALTLAFTDTHAMLNGHTPESIESYFEELTQAAQDRGFPIERLSVLMASPDVMVNSESAALIPPADLLADLRISAAKWFKGQGTAEEGAIRYFQANMVERQVMGQVFPRSIFVTFNGSQLRRLFPEHLPIFYMYSVRHGISDKPWFLPPDFMTGESRAKVPCVEVATTA